MLDQLAATSANEQGRVVVSGPTWLLAPAIRGATAEAAEHLVSVLRRFTRDGDGTPEELRDAISAASAWSETLMGSEHVQRHGLPASFDPAGTSRGRPVGTVCGVPARPSSRA